MSKNVLVEESAPRPAEAAKGPVSFAWWDDPRTRAQLVRFGLAAAALCLVFVKPLYDLVRFALDSELYSHLLLIPFVSIYLIWFRKHERIPASAPAAIWSVVPALIGIGAVISFWVLRQPGSGLGQNDYLAMTTLAFVMFVASAWITLVGRAAVKANSFALGFLIMFVPFPTFFEQAIEVFFQVTSAAMAHFFLIVTNTPVFRHGLNFQLPGITLTVASECSGIRSSLVLFITSLIAGQMFLRSPWKRLILAVAVIPLGIVRNGLRILTIAELCVHVDPSMIDSFIHRKGGPLFFLLSLIPFFALLFVLRKLDFPAKPKTVQTH